MRLLKLVEREGLEEKMMRFAMNLTVRQPWDDCEQAGGIWRIGKEIKRCKIQYFKTLPKIVVTFRLIETSHRKIRKGRQGTRGEKFLHIRRRTALIARIVNDDLNVSLSSQS